MTEVVDALAPAINGVHVLPFHPSSGDGGFSVRDHAVVDSAVGVWSDLADLGTRHRLMADAVVNHVSAQGTWFRSWLAGDPAVDGFFRTLPPDVDLGAVVRPRPGAPVASFRRRGEPVDVWATFSADQVDLDYRTPAVLLAIVEVLLRYVAAGADAIRLDAVAYLWKEPARPSIHEPETHALVAVMRSVLDDVDPSIVLITETNVPHADNVSYFGSTEEPEADAVYQFTLAPLVLHAALTGDAGPLRSWAEQLRRPAGTTFVNFLASHDGVGVRPARGWLEDDQIEALAEACRSVGGVVNEAASGGGSEPYELAATWRALCGHGADDETADDRVLATHAVMFALAGVPLVYAHSLAASGNDTARFAATGHGRDLNRGRFAAPAAFLDAATSRGSELLSLLARRRSCPAFHPDADQRIRPAERGLFVIERSAGSSRALVAVNFGPEPAPVDIGRGWLDAAGDELDETVMAAPLAVVWAHVPA
ncbi:MAG: sucrose phosphorylase [Acidimicrobiales bacterium]|nr:MAG: sucrose phosphorylase [Acidimicrobiales bacterium]